jgi:hypothetical protein
VCIPASRATSESWLRRRRNDPLLLRLSYPVATRREFLARLEAFDAIAQGVNGPIDRMLYFPARQAWDHGRAPALLDILANGFAVVSFVPGHLLGIAVDVVHQGRIGGDIVSLAGPDLDTSGRPSALVRALISVEKPTRERPSGLRAVSPFHRLRSDVRG